MCQQYSETFQEVADALAGIQREHHCTRCGRWLPASMFTRNPTTRSGHDYKLGRLRSPCRDCFNSRERVERNREKTNVRARARYAADPSRLKAQVQRWAAANPEKVQAHTKLQWAVESGRLNRKPCEICGSEQSEAHHHDYTKPLDVYWLCTRHHRQLEHGLICLIR